MTGAYVDSDDLARLLTRPTKATARDCYCRQITYWFQSGPDGINCSMDWITDPAVHEIAERHGCENDYGRLCEDTVEAGDG